MVKPTTDSVNQFTHVRIVVKTVHLDRKNSLYRTLSGVLCCVKTIDEHGIIAQILLVLLLALVVVPVVVAVAATAAEKAVAIAVVSSNSSSNLVLVLLVQYSTVVTTGTYEEIMSAQINDLYEETET